MSETKAIADLVTGAALVPSIVTDKWGRQHAFVPKSVSGSLQPSFERVDITPKGAVKIDPAFIDQAVNIDQTVSLIDYVNRFKTNDTIILANVDDLEIVAVIDYHKAGSSEPGLAEHHAVLSLTHSAEWTQWAEISGRMYKQPAFARLLDINSDDIAQPDSATLLETVLDMERNVQVTVGRKLESSGSDRGTTGASKISDGTVLPPFFMLSIPVFTGEPKVDVRAMTKDSFDTEKGVLSLGLELVRTRIIVETELARIARAIATATSVPVMMGSLAASQS